MTQLSTSLRTQTSIAPSLVAATHTAGYIARRVAPAAMTNLAHPARVIGGNLNAQRPRSIEETLFDARASCKISTRQYAMLFDPEWQKRFFQQIDQLMDTEDWDSTDEPVTSDSFATLLRLLMCGAVLRICCSMVTMRCSRSAVTIGATP